MIDPNERADIELSVMQKYDIFDDLKWKAIDKGLINKTYFISSSDETPLAVCKFYTEDDIYPPEVRMERETQALEMMGGRGTPDLLYSNKKGIIVYTYITGIALNEARNFQDREERVSSSIESIHQISMQSKKALKSDVVDFYENIMENYTVSETNYPKDLISELKQAYGQTVKLLDKKEDCLTYVHGDLVPANFIVGQNYIQVIDWEFFRPELKLYDYTYFDYYAKAHKMNFSLTKNYEREDVTKYTKLVKALDDLWWYGNKHKQEN